MSLPPQRCRRARCPRPPAAPCPERRPGPEPLPPAPDLKWWNRLGVRLTIAIALVTLATVAVLLLLVLRAQERHLVALVVQAPTC